MQDLIDDRKMVEHPLHYSRLTPEPIDLIESWELNFCLGNCVKYISRAGFKDPNKAIEDLKKARFYLDREIHSQEQKQFKKEELNNNKEDNTYVSRFCAENPK